VFCNRHLGLLGSVCSPGAATSAGEGAGPSGASGGSSLLPGLSFGGEAGLVSAGEAAGVLTALAAWLTIEGGRLRSGRFRYVPSSLIS
jgi:hypothetical protein